MHELIKTEPKNLNLPEALKQIGEKLAYFVNQETNFRGGNNSPTLMAVLSRFSNQEDLNRALAVIFRPLVELDIAEYFRGKNGSVSISE